MSNLPFFPLVKHSNETLSSQHAQCFILPREAFQLFCYLFSQSFDAVFNFNASSQKLSFSPLSYPYRGNNAYPWWVLSNPHEKNTLKFDFNRGREQKNVKTDWISNFAQILSIRNLIIIYFCIENVVFSKLNNMKNTFWWCHKLISVLILTDKQRHSQNIEHSLIHN